MHVSVNLQGAKELENKLKRLELKTARKIVRKAVRSGAKVIADQIKSNARSMVGGAMGGLIARKTSVRAFRRQRKGQYGVSATLRPDEEFVHKTKDGKRYFIPAAIEYGHATAGEGGRGIKTVPALPFTRNAVDTKKNQALEKTNKQIAEGIEMEYRK